MTSCSPKKFINCSICWWYSTPYQPQMPWNPWTDNATRISRVKWMVLWIELNWSSDMEHAHGRDGFSNYEMEELCWEHSGEQSWVENETEKREEHWTLRASRKHWVENSWTYLCMNLFYVCCSCNWFSLLIYVLQKIQRAELFSINSRFPKTLKLYRQSWGKMSNVFRTNGSRTINSLLHRKKFMVQS